MRIAAGCDHRGLDLKNKIISSLIGAGYELQDMGSYDLEPVDYPDIAVRVADSVRSGQSDFGILLCSTGIGMSMAANKVRGIRAALCCDEFDAVRARQHNDANVLCLGANKINPDQAIAITKAFIVSQFEGGRHQKRLEKIKMIEARPIDNI